MAGRRRLTLKDIEDFDSEVEEAGNIALQGSITGRRRLNLQDIYPEDDSPLAEEPFEGGSTLQATVPLPGDWPTVDTGISIGKSTAQALAGAGKRFSDLGRRGRQLVGRPGVQEEIDEAKKRDAPLMATTPGILGHMLPDMIGLAPVAGPAAIAGRAVNLSGYGVGMGIGGLQAASMPVSSDDSGWLNVGMGTLGGGLGTAVARGVGALGGKLANLTPGVIPDSMRAAAARRGVTLPEVRWRDAEAERLFDLTRARNVPMAIGDLDPRSMWRSTESLMESLPSGRRKHLERQQAAVRNQVEDLRGSFAGAARGREGVEIREGLRRRHNDLRQEASRRFQIVDDISRNDPRIEPIRPLETYRVAQETLDRYPDLLNEFQNNRFIRRVLGIERDTGPQPGLVIDPTTNQPFNYDQELSFAEAQFVRKQLGAWYDKLHKAEQKGNLPQGLNRESVAQAGRIFSAFDNDLDRWGMQPASPTWVGPEQPPNRALNEAWQNAREFFRDNVAPYRNPELLESKTPLIRDALGNQKLDPATIPAKALPTRETTIAQDVMDLADERGQAAMKSALINKMTEESLSLVPEGLDTASLLRHTLKHGHSGESVFTPTELQRITDTRDIARAAGRSGDLSRLHDAGGRLVSALLGGGAMAGVPYMGMQLSGSTADLTPGERAAVGFAALPMAIAIGSRGMHAYNTRPFFQNIHFADPELSGLLGALQRYGIGALRGAGQPTLEEFRSGELGHRP